jgi:hypothetical protein
VYTVFTTVIFGKALSKHSLIFIHHPAGAVDRVAVQIKLIRNIQVEYLPNDSMNGRIKSCGMFRTNKSITPAKCHVFKL